MDTNDGRREMRRVDWDFVPEAVVVGNGEFPVSALPLRMLDTASFTVCCDGAVIWHRDACRIGLWGTGIR